MMAAPLLRVLSLTLLLWFCCCSPMMVVRVMATVPAGSEADPPVWWPSLTSWIAAAGGLVSDGITIATAVGGGDGERGRGVQARVDLPAGTVIMEIPTTIMFTETTALAALTGWPDDAPPETHEGDVAALSLMPLTNAMALLLLAHRELAAASPFAPFLASLPLELDAVPSTINFAPAELELLQGSALLAYSQQRNHTIAQFWTALVPFWRRFPLAEFQWALSVLWSRTISVQVDGKSQGALVPVADLFNAGPSSPITARQESCGADPTQRCLRYLLHQPVLAGTELVTEYGTRAKQPNAELLFYYGFTMPDNPDDVVMLPVDCDPAEAHYQQRQQILQEMELAPRHYPLTRPPTALPPALVIFGQICVLEGYKLGAWQSWLAKPSQRLQEKARQFLARLVEAQLQRYPRPEATDQQRLAALQALPARSRAEYNEMNALVVTLSERAILHHFRSLL